MHGSPLLKWKDSDLWDDYDYEDFDVVAEAFLSFKDKKIQYYTDTSRRWDSHRTNVRDKVETKLKSVEVKTTFDLIDTIPRIDNDIYINVHPQRWDDNLISWAYQKVSQNIKNLGKFFINH